MTAQIHERLILNGEKTSMAFCPPLPAEHPRISEGDPDAPNAPGFLNTTACWRGYQGTWEIKDGHFYLVGIQGRFVLSEGEPLLADWFSGVLRIPRGELLQYVHMGFGSVYEEEIHLKIVKGKVAATRVIDNREKSFDGGGLTMRNLPGGENRFPGDDDW